MKAEKCRFCGEHHWERVCPNLTAGPTTAAKWLAEPMVREALKRHSEKASKLRQEPAKSDAERVKRWRAKNRDRYNAYMRAYRARKRLNSPKA